MSNPTNNNLKDFLQKSDSEPLDDFDKDALEGFYTLSSEQEAIDAKSQLDKRIYSEVFSQKKSNSRVYWLAAAGLFLVIGLSIFFVLNNDSVLNKKDMALVSPNETNNIEGKVMEETASEKITDQQNALPKEEKETLKNDKLPANAETAGEKNSAGKTLGPQTANGAGSTMHDHEAEIADNKKSADISLAQDATKDKTETILDDVKNEESENKSKVNANEQSKNALEEFAANAPSLSDELKKEVRLESKSKRKKESQKSAATTKSQPVAVPEKSESFENDGLANNRAASREDNDAKTKPSGIPSSPSAEPKGKADVSSTCYYTGGEIALVKHVREKLIEKKLNKPFEAIMFINEKKVVEKVTFTKLYSLNKDDETHIAEILRGLNQFNFLINLPSKNLHEYKFLYTP